MSAPCNTKRRVRIDFTPPQGVEIDEYVVKFRVMGSSDEYTQFTVPGPGYLADGIPGCYDLEFLIETYCQGVLVGTKIPFPLYVLNPDQFRDEIVNVPFEISSPLPGKNGGVLNFQRNPFKESFIKYNATTKTYMVDINWFWILGHNSSVLEFLASWPELGKFGVANGKITDSRYFPKVAIPLTGVDHINRPLTGSIDTSGNIWLSTSANGIIMGAKAGNANDANIRLSNTTSEGDFTQPPASTPPTTRPPRTGTDNVTPRPSGGNTRPSRPR